MYWDFITLREETVYQVLRVFTDLGTPDGYRYMHGYGIHTFKMVNAQDDAVYVKFHYLSNQGIRNLTAARATELAGTDPDYATRDLYNAIANATYPSWNLSIQVMTFDEAERFRWNPFDVTKTRVSHRELCEVLSDKAQNEYQLARYVESKLNIEDCSSDVLRCIKMTLSVFKCRSQERWKERDEHAYKVPMAIPPLSRHRRSARFRWTREHQRWEEKRWGSVLFTDETRICLRPDSSLMLAGNEFQNLGRAIVKEDEYEEVRRDGIVSIVSWRERVFRCGGKKEDEYPLKPVGTLVLDRNPTNYFAQMEQIAFSPSNTIPGIEPSPDKLLQVIYIFKSLDQLFG
ncbi:hypothetical protein ANN_19305 [Periplaneta americana]|uniref:Catalase core domain-containing protein n=1 Tax=Periplaneta americana TaxID=6978 RepID=A0ABQ8SA33_PERAM|nr:hypothetical protein ANN_19305 [Periplaneta americana]